MPDLPTATVADLWRWGPCGGRRRWQHITDRYEDEPWTALDVLDYRTLPLSWVSDRDRLWVVRNGVLLPPPVRREASRLRDARWHARMFGLYSVAAWDAEFAQQVRDLRCLLRAYVREMNPYQVQSMTPAQGYVCMNARTGKKH